MTGYEFALFSFGCLIFFLIKDIYNLKKEINILKEIIEEIKNESL